MSKTSTELHDAAVKRNTEAVRSLVKTDADLVHARDEKQRTPLQLASRGGCLEVVELLIEAGADVNTTDEKFQTPLQMAAYYGFKEIVTLLLARGARVNAANRWQITPLQQQLHHVVMPEIGGEVQRGDLPAVGGVTRSPLASSRVTISLNP